VTSVVKAGSRASGCPSSEALERDRTRQDDDVDGDSLRSAGVERHGHLTHGGVKTGGGDGGGVRLLRVVGLLHGCR
jgi:hypothetical protein